ncbi:uncharacterized protein BKA78DRAFT_320311 [Phyllosticta capitalensis]|uniref:uncharacterized protein n=1 Tax=Phyllosticta capitalensis TaxID=121624 RepID=UPI00312DD4C8
MLLLHAAFCFARSLCGHPGQPTWTDSERTHGPGLPTAISRRPGQVKLDLFLDDRSPRIRRRATELKATSKNDLSRWLSSGKLVLRGVRERRLCNPQGPTYY